MTKLYGMRIKYYNNTPIFEEISPKYPVETEYSHFSGCCGSSFRGEITDKIKDKLPHNTKGIHLYLGDLGRSFKNTKNNCDVVNTKNGPLTIIVRKEW